MRFCEDAFPQFQRQMRHLLMTPLEFFCEGVEWLDYLLEDEKHDAVFAGEMWDKMFIRYQQWEKTADVEEVDLAVACVYSTVVAAVSCSPVSRHYHSMNMRLNQGMGTYVEKNPSFWSFMERHLDAHSGSLRAWMKEYVASEVYDSDRIADIVKTRRAVTVEDEKLQYDRATFKPNGLLPVKLTLVQNEIFRSGWLVNDEPDRFLALFSGKCNDVVLVWRNGVGVGNLLALFQRMIKRKFIKCPEGYSVQDILEGHFVNESGEHISLKGAKAAAKANQIIDTCIGHLEMENPGTCDV